MNGLPEIISSFGALSSDAAQRELHLMNEYTAGFNLTLSESEIREIVVSRSEALKAAGRVELGGSILPKLIRAFCDSPFITQESYAQTLCELQEAFYYYKSESMDSFSDDELIEYMVKVYNGRAQGSAEYLESTSLETLARYARNGFDERDADDAGDLF